MTTNLTTQRICGFCETPTAIWHFPVYYTSNSGTGWLGRLCKDCAESRGMAFEKDALEKYLLNLQGEEMNLKAQMMELKKNIREIKTAIGSIEKGTYQTEEAQ